MGCSDFCTNDDAVAVDDKFIDELKIQYKIEKDDDEIKIFGKNFVIFNKDICNIICEGNEYDLDEFYDLRNYSEGKDLLEITLKGINNLTKIREIFQLCSKLISIPDISKWNTKNITDMSGIFSDCSSLTSLPNI